MKNTLLFLCILFSGIAFSQNIDLNGTKWVSKQQQVLRFKEKSVSLTDASFLSKYTINGTTIEFTHDFSYISEVTVGDKTVPRSEYEVPDSRFKISYSPDSIRLTAINPAAIYVASTINRKHSSLDEKLFIEWEKTGEQPTELRYQRLDSVMTFASYQSTKNERHVSGIYLTTSCYNMDRKYYTDLVIDSIGFLHARSIQQDYDKGSKPEFSYFEGQLDAATLQKLDSLFSFSGMPDNSTVSYSGWTSHSLNIGLTITHSKGTIYANGIRSSMSDLERKFFDAFFGLIEEKKRTDKSEFVFEQSKFDADSKK